ncbi:MAG TPA: anaerobic glycerol-3-phosphate dehydrogenase subunit C [Nitrospiria bacterium]|nr:anaerobic glycerol-3-phosphate dehydrogenase subunit C [Nitrospiria bacterium]
MNFNPALPLFWDEKAHRENLLRVFDVCHGCRRCFNLCPSFADLFNTIDEDRIDGDVKKLSDGEIRKVVDDCYYCRLCYNHCPYHTPHAYDLDFPRLMVQAKIQNAKKKKSSFRDRFLVNTDLSGRLFTPLAPLVNFGNRIGFLRIILEKVLGIHRERLLPDFASRTFRSWFKGRKKVETRGAKKVVLFYTCHVNYNTPEIGKASLEVLERNGIEVAVPPQVCCGMPFFDTGEIDRVLEKAQFNLDEMEKWVDRGYDIVIPVPTCSLMLKKEYPDLYQTEQARKVAAATFDLSEYLFKLHREGGLALDFKQTGFGKISWQVPCHLRDQNIGYKSRDLLKLIPGTEVEVIEKCSGHDGSWGVKTEFFKASMKVGGPLFRMIEEGAPARVASDCPLAGIQIAQGTGKKAAHPIEILNEAYKGKADA